MPKNVCVERPDNFKGRRRDCSTERDEELGRFNWLVRAGPPDGPGVAGLATRRGLAAAQYFLSHPCRDFLRIWLSRSTIANWAFQIRVQSRNVSRSNHAASYKRVQLSCLQ